MILSQLKPSQALNKAFLKVKPNRIDIERFKTNLIQLLDTINDTESEEFHKNLISDFLKKTYFDPNHFINTKGRNDLVIHNGDKANSSVGVIIEAKKFSNKSEMIKPQSEGESQEQMIANINKKAFQELVLYYLRERITLNNLEVKHLIITNINEWFIFDASTFDRLFAQNKIFVQQFNDFEAGRLSDTTTDFFYKEIASPFIAHIKTNFSYAYFNIQDYQPPLRNNDIADDKKLIGLYKLLSPEHLLKLPFANDSNSLDKRFYTELLHIIGLTETKDKGKKLIQREKEGDRNTGSILEDAIIQLDSLDKISRLEHPDHFGETYQERLFHVALELSITWINRILFLKLLEAQLITYHKNANRDAEEYAFLNLQKIKNYDDLNSLFFQVLARKEDERNIDVKSLFDKIPYLNSSLFEPTELEQVTLFISNLKDDKTIPILSNTVLKDAQGKKKIKPLPTLRYLFEFLDAYDFSSEGKEEIQEDNKTLINASVLGLIFEKINGYKDGSIFTPGFITMYMSRETIRKAVVQKFNEYKGWKCASFEELKEDIREEIKAGDRKKVRKIANDIINSLRIVDPAVGSGHFLVSGLNEMIAIKSELRILVDSNFEPLSNQIVEVVNDQLVVTDENGDLFEYNPYNKESLRVQKTLFHEKQTIIENCLFGVDINPNSVKICRLRLWIELLKNSYYKEVLTSTSFSTLETLPNIDINIKSGNSLVSRFALDADLRSALKKSKYSIESYQVAVNTYRNAQNKEEKREMERLITAVKSDFRSEIASNDPKIKKLSKLKGDLFTETNQTSLFDQSKKEKQAWRKRIDKLTQEVQKLEIEIEEIKNNKIFENAFEWRFEFPEVLNSNGDFVGFDVVIGNPPYIQLQAIKEISKKLQNLEYQTYDKTGDLYALFYEKGNELLKQNGILSFITSNKWMRAGYGKNLRNYLLTNTQPQILIDLGSNIFEHATVDCNILIFTKNKGTDKVLALDISKEPKIENVHSFTNNFISIKPKLDESWIIASEDLSKIKEKIELNGVPLKDYDIDIYRGILTGLNEAFTVTEEQRNKIIEADPKSADFIKPLLRGRDIKKYYPNFQNLYLIYIPKGFTIKSKNEVKNKITEPVPRYGYYEIDEAWEWFKTQLPAIAEHLKPFEQKAKKRQDMGDYWWELRACAYLDEFEKEKIVYNDICQKLTFSLVDKGVSFNNTAYFLNTNSYYILALLNSKLMDWYYRTLSVQLGSKGIRMFTIYVEKIPIARINSNLEKKFDKIVEKILNNKKSNIDTYDLEKQIDQMVYELYGLTEEEIKIVEGN